MEETEVAAQDFNTGMDFLGDICASDWSSLEAWIIEGPGKRGAWKCTIYLEINDGR